MNLKVPKIDFTRMMVGIKTKLIVIIVAMALSGKTALYCIVATILWSFFKSFMKSGLAAYVTFFMYRYKL